MRFQRVSATRLRLRAYAPVLHLFARLIERVISIDVADDVRVNDIFARVATYLRELAQETATVEDVIADFRVTKGLVEVADTLDSVQTLGVTKAATEAVTALDALRRTLGRRVTDRAEITESLRFASAHRLRDIVNQFPEQVRLHTSTPVTESVSTADSESRVWAFGRLLSEGGDYVVEGYWEDDYYLPSPAVSDQIRLRPSTRHTESVSLAETFARAATQQRTLTEAVPTAETRVFRSTKGLTETPAATDAVAKTLQLYILEGGLYADPTYFFDSDYVSGGLSVGESFSLT